MSCITNNLIVLSVDCKEQFLSDFERFKDEFRLANLLDEYSGKKFVAYSFDCNGENPWYSYSYRYGYFKVNIIDYLDGDDQLITTCRRNGAIKELDDCWQDVLGKYLPKEVINSLEDYFSV